MENIIGRFLHRCWNDPEICPDIVGGEPIDWIEEYLDRLENEVLKSAGIGVLL